MTEEEFVKQAKDAERYRKLRSCHWWKSPLAVVVNPKEAVRLGAHLPFEDFLDKILDEMPEVP